MRSNLPVKILSPTAWARWTGWLSVVAVVLAAAAPPVDAACGGRETAYPISESLWLPDFRPADDPTKALPDVRDSTAWVTTFPSNAQWGFELRKDIEILANFAFTAYNAGLEVWDISGGNAASPMRVAYADAWGYCGQCQSDGFLSEPGFGEIDTYFDDIDVFQGAGNEILIALSGRVPAGLTLWKFNTSTHYLKAVYQDPNRGATSVSIAEHGGKFYVFSATTSGVDVYNFSTALAVGPCLDSSGSGCGGVYRGKVGDMTKGAWVDTVIANPGRLHIVASDGTTAAPLTLEIWEVPEPDGPGGAIERFNGSGIQSLVHAPVFFEHGGVHYLAFIERSSTQNLLKIYDVQTCLDANGLGVCSSLGTERYSTKLLFTGSRQKLTFSESSTVAGKTPFLYYGLPEVNLYGPRLDLLLNLSTLGGTNAITEMTEGAPTYFDHCVNKDLDYWAWYYKGNEFGFNQFAPLAGKFNGTYFYRVNNSTFDVHIWGEGGGPVEGATVMASVVGNPPYWMGDPTTFDASVANCTPIVGGWCWTTSTASANLSVSPPACNASASDPQILTFNCTLASGRCADASVEISTWNSECGEQATGTTIPDTITLSDPTVEITSVDAGGQSFPICQMVDFTGQLVGRGPVTWSWTIDGEPQPDCDGSEAGSVDLSTTAISCTFDPSGVAFDGIFTDGFESGNLSSWSLISGSALLAAPTKSADTADVTAVLTVSNGGVLDQDQLTVVITQPSVPVFDGTPTETLTGATLDLTYPALNAATWHWEFEDPSGPSFCDFTGKPGVACEVVETTSDSTSHAWFDAGTFAYKVKIIGCDPEQTDETEGEATIDVGTPPTISVFAFNGAQPDCCGTGIFSPFKCQAGKTVEFKVTMAEAGTWGFGFDWERGSPGASPSFVSQSPTGSSSNDWYFQHVFSRTGNSYPKAQATSGPFSDQKDFNFPPIEITSGVPNCN